MARMIPLGRGGQWTLAEPCGGTSQIDFFFLFLCKAKLEEKRGCNAMSEKSQIE